MVLPPLEEVTFLGRGYSLRRGTVDKGDYDDGWLHAVALISETVFDIGSNIGQSAFNMLNSATVKRVVLVDPSIRALTIAADSLIRSHLSERVVFVHGFVSDADELLVEFDVDSASTGGVATGRGQDAACGSGSVVPTLRIDTLSERLQLIPDFVKVDAVGQEEKVLEGACRVARRQGTRFMVEMHAVAGRTQKIVTTAVLDWCRGNRYEAWYMKLGETIVDPMDVEHRGRYHLLLQPTGWPYPKALQGLEQGSTAADAAGRAMRPPA